MIIIYPIPYLVDKKQTHKGYSSTKKEDVEESFQDVLNRELKKQRG